MADFPSVRFEEFLANSNLNSEKHQLDGVKWCYKNEVDGHKVDEKIVRGGLLADEMGLGKTIQMLGVMSCNKKDHTLIVLPKALLNQWRDAIIYTMDIIPLVFHDSGNRKANKELLETSPIVLTTYSLITQRTPASTTKKTKKTQSKSKPKTYTPVSNAFELIQSIKWDRIIFDEAHHVRNTRTNIFKGATSLISDIRWLVTGTPIQNRKSDFYSLCAVMGIPETYYTKNENLMDMVRKFIKKRTKDQVGIKLPELRTNTINVEWKNEKERDLAEDLHSMLQFTRVNKAASKINNSIAVMGHHAGNTVLPLLIKARQMCVLPSLVSNSINRFTEMGLMEENKEVIESLHQSSSKMDAVIQTIIDRKDNGRQKLIFCHFRGEIDYIKKNLEEQGNMTVLTLDGRSTEKQRIEALSCENRMDALILQIQTGCEGLNLQQFNEVYFVSPHWNPAVEDQAIARCHRIGQTNDIDVFRFAMGGFDEENETRSLDEYASNLQDAKRHVMKVIEEEPEQTA